MRSSHHAKLQFNHSWVGASTVGAVIMLLCAKGGLAEEPPAPPSATLVVVVGAAGDAEYADAFGQSAKLWQSVASRQNWRCYTIQEPQSGTAKSELQATIAEVPTEHRLWIVLLGHGTFARGTAKFNLPGPDVSAKELHAWLRARPDNQLTSAQNVLINCASASAPFLSQSTDPRTLVVSATKSGSEINYSRFGTYLAQSVNDLSVDLDHDHAVSLLEAFLAASSQTARFYEQEARLATEHALLNDNGDQVGTSADFYRGANPVKDGRDNVPIDGAVAAKLIVMKGPDSVRFTPELDGRRRQIEARIAAWRARKAELDQTAYYDQLEVLLLELAALYDLAEAQ